MKKLGVLGGMGPAAAAEFLRLLALYMPAESDQQHPIVYMLSDPTTPDRVAGILGQGDDPSPVIYKNLRTLISWGADAIAVPCNTAHYFIDKFKADLKIPLIHIVEATLSQAAKLGSKAWLFATLGTMRSNLYQDYATAIGYDLMIPSPKMQDEVESVLRLVKAGKLPESGNALKKIVENVLLIEDIPIMLACTELPLAYEASGMKGRNISSLSALAKACVDFVLSDR
ncbi:MAG: amino acid racemase [Synergistaceae bacterium]|nr:amino acid racemase [Synergistaceae bacterium]